MAFFLCLWLVVEWRNFVLLSPCCIYREHDLCHHISFSLSSKSFISFWRRWISSANSWSVSRDSKYWSLSCFSFSCLSTRPKTFLFHHWSCCWQLLIWSYVVGTSLEVCGMDHASSTTSLHSASWSHIVSKWNRSFFLLFLGVWDEWKIKE